MLATMKPTNANALPRTHVSSRQKSVKLTPIDNLTVSAKQVSLAPTKQQICLDMLVKGYVHSFVDFFFLSHQTEEKQHPSQNSSKKIGTQTQTAIESTDETEADKIKELSEDTLLQLQENLTVAELSQRQGDAASIIAAYEKLASHFEAQKSFRIAIHFHQKCLDIAQQIGDVNAEGKANRNLGISYEKMGGNITRAIHYYEVFFELAKSLHDNEQILAARRHLVNAYRTYAHVCSEKADHEGEVQYLKKALEQALQCEDVVTEGLIHYRLGQVYQMLNAHDVLIDHLRSYLEICRRTKDEAGEATACAALASAYGRVGNVELSIQFLEENIELAQRTNQTIKRADANSELGVIYNQAGQYEKAIECFEQYLELAKQMGDKKMIDQARVCLGIARGNKTYAEDVASSK